MRRSVWFCALLSLGGCGPETEEAGSDPVLTPATEARLVEVRPCRLSVEHPFNHVRVLVEPELAERYDRGPFPFPPGTVVVKREYSDRDCAAPLGTTLMRKEPPGYHVAFGDWRWQRLDAAGRVVEDGRLAGCASCHSTAACRARDYVCSDPD